MDQLSMQVQTDKGLRCTIAHSGPAWKDIVRGSHPDSWNFGQQTRPQVVIIIIQTHGHWKVAWLFNEGPGRRKSRRLGTRNSEEEAYLDNIGSGHEVW